MRVHPSYILVSSILTGFARGSLLPRQSNNATTNNANLQTWWHPTGQINTNSAVSSGDVRQSRRYMVQVQSAGDSTYYNSFVYETIPGNGLGHSGNPDQGSLDNFNSGRDGITIEEDIGTSMAWSSFLHASAVTVKVHRPNMPISNVNQVTIRPTTLNYGKTVSGGDLFISVPYKATGTRFSVEFADELYSYHNLDAGTQSHFVQTNNSADSGYYVPNFDSSMPVVGVEPLNALLIFASPMESLDMTPDINAPTTYIQYPGQINTTALQGASNTALYFKPGVHYCGGRARLTLSNSFSWVYIAPGAYVKCAILFGEPGQNGATQFKVTGHGVLSGEQYVFQADPDNFFLTRDDSHSNDEPVRMFRGQSTNNLQQYFILNGPTVNAPPFQSMDFTGDLNTLSCYVSDYKMVGAYFGETDGLENYSGSRVSSVFYHSNDDTLKMYSSNVTVQNVVVWKGSTAPVIQFGWASYNLNNILVDSVDTIHARWNRNDSHPSLIGANQEFHAYSQGGDNLTNTANVDYTAQNIVFSNLRLEGIGGSLLRVCPLETYSNISIINVSIEQRAVNSSFIPVSEFPYFTDVTHNSGVGVSNFRIRNFTIGGKPISMALNNWNSSSLGGFNIAKEYLGSNGVTIA